MMEKLKGTGVAMVTPFLTNGKVDYPNLEKLVNHLTEGGVEFLVVMGTTGESATMTTEEQTEVLQYIQKCNKKTLPIVLGIGGNDTAALIEKVKNTNLEGVDAILSASPYYNKPTQEGIYQHYKALASATDKAIILYNVPGRTSSNISAATTLRLNKDFKNIIGIKEASGDLSQMMDIYKDKTKDFLILSGDDTLTLPMIACGGDGVISVIANSHPRIFSNMVRGAMAGDFTLAKKNHYQLKTLIDLLFEEGNPGGIKAVLKELNIGEEYMRLPLWPITENLRKIIKAEVKKVG